MTGAAGHLKPAGTVVAFLLLALLQNQDLVLSNRLLGSVDAAHFAVLSTLGGAAAFATVTVPLVLLGRAGRAPAASLAPALGVAAALGAAITLIATIVPDLLVVAFGAQYADVSGLAPVYLLAMALLGIARVLVAHRCATGKTASSLVMLLVAVAAHLTFLVWLGTDPAGIARATLMATGLLVAMFSASVVVQFPNAQSGAAIVRGFLANRKAVMAAVGIALLALAVRLMFARGIWVDEAISIHQAQLPFSEMMTSVRSGDVHPPLHHMILWLTVRAFGTSELAVRLPSIAIGVGAVGMLYLTGRDLYDRATGRLAAFVGAVSPLLVWYSQEARMYSLFMFLALVALWAQVKAVREGRLWSWALYGLATAALLWTHYFSLLPIAVQQAAFLVAGIRRWRIRRTQDTRLRPFVAGWVMSAAIVAAAVAPLVPVITDQVAAYGQRSAELPSQVGAAAAPSVEKPSIYAVVANFVWSLWGYHSDSTMILLGALWPLGLLICLLTLGRGRSWQSTLLAALVVVPVGILFAVGIFRRDLFEVRYFAGAVPALVLLVARALRRLTPHRVIAVIAAGALVLSMGVALADQQLNRSNPRIYDFEGALEEIAARARPRDEVLFAPVFLENVIDYYTPDLRHKLLDIDSLPKRKEARRVFLVGSFLDIKQHSATVGAGLAKLEQGRRLVDQFEKPQVKVWVFR